MKILRSFYRLDNGLISAHWSGSQSQLEGNIPSGHGHVPGHHDPASKRVDIDTGEVVDYQRPDDPERERRRRRRESQARIAALEQTQWRPMRELSIDPKNAEARRRLEAIDAEIAELRTQLNQSLNQS